MKPGAAPLATAQPRIPWWLWPTVLSLDAPAVALVWQANLEHSSQASLSPHHRLLLLASVWMAYAGDRWIEAWRLPADSIRTARHAFAQSHRWSLLSLWTGVLSVSLWLAAHTLTAREWLGSLGMLALVCLYVLLHQWLGRRQLKRLPKELLVALIFTGGCTLYPLLSRQTQAGALLLPSCCLTLLALANCLFISHWEREVDLSHGNHSLASTGKARPLARLCCLLLFLLCVTSTGLPAPFGVQAPLPFLASAGLLATLDHFEKRLGRRPARALADLCLLTPILAFF